jgi:Papain family cysteine protease
MNTTPEGFGLGWLADHPDIRDHTVDTDSAPAGKQHSVAALLKEVPTPATPPKSVDLRADFSPVEDQGQLGSCTANAGAGMVEYFQRRAYGKYVDLSRLFLYKTTRDLLGVHGDTGAYLRSTMQALATFGAPPEVYWPYDTTKFDIEPSAFLYTFGQDYKAEIYYRLDPPGTTGSALVDVIKQQLARQLPAMFGFTVYSSYQQSLTNGGGRPRDRGLWLRRCQEGDQHQQRRRLDQGRVPDPELVGVDVGRERLRLAALQVRHQRAGRRLVEPDQRGLDRHGRVQLDA